VHKHLHGRKIRSAALEPAQIPFFTAQADVLQSPWTRPVAWPGLSRWPSAQSTKSLRASCAKLDALLKSCVSWLGKIEARGGGNNDGEAIERALEAISEAGHFDAVVVAGDEPPNSRAFLRTINRGDALLAADMARRFGQANTPIHTFVVGDDPRTINAFAEVSSLSGGKSGRLDGSAEMIDMAVMAMLAALKGTEAVKTYMRDYHVTSKSAEFGRLLIEGPKK
jgi:hypothetical protein